MSEEKKGRSGFFRRLLKREGAQTEPEPEAAHAESEVEPQPILDSTPTVPQEESEHAGPGRIAEPPDEMSAFSRLKLGLKKTRSSFFSSLNQVFLGKAMLDEEVVGRLEEALVRSDIGIKTAYELLETLRERVKSNETDDPDAVTGHLKSLIQDILSAVEAPLRIGDEKEPFVIMVVGVNGSGKTTTMAKMAARYKKAGKSVLLAAADTFRAAAVDQVEAWAQRVGCEIVKGKERADPSSVAFEAVEQALKGHVDIVLVDTAGRLHTRTPLMDELKKVRRTLAKKLPQAPHETLLVIDASMGQNAILQAKTFNEAIPVTGIALTKLDGTAKGGVIVGISNELKIPVRYIGIGEKMDDLRDFSAQEFVEALFAKAEDSVN